MASTPKAKAGPLIVFRCPKDLDEEILKIANFNLLERTDIIILAAEQLLHHIQQIEEAIDSDLNRAMVPHGDIDLERFDDPSLDEVEPFDETGADILPGNKMPWD